MTPERPTRPIPAYEGRAENAIRRADQSLDQARRSRDALNDAVRLASSINDDLDSKENLAARRAGEAAAEASAYERASARAQTVRAELNTLIARAASASGCRAGEVGSDLDEAEARVASARSRLRACELALSSHGDRAMTSAAAAERARLEVEQARAQARAAQLQADLAAEQAELHEQGARTEQAAAIAAVVDAAHLESGRRVITGISGLLQWAIEKGRTIASRGRRPSDRSPDAPSSDDKD